MRAWSIVVACVVLGSAMPARAQGVAVGVKAGVSVANLQFIEEDEKIDLDGRVGFVGGVFLIWPANQRFALQTEALYVQKGASHNAVGLEAHLNLDYVDVPVLLRVSTAGSGSGPAFHVFGGPSVGVRVRARSNAVFDGESSSVDVGDDVKRLDVGLVAGAGIDVGRFVVDARFTWGLSNINNNPREDDTTTKHRVFAATAGLRF